MRLPASLARHPVRFNMTPMIDIVFLLIIFFLVSSHLAQRENRVQLDLPAAVSGQTAVAHDHPRITVNVLNNGQILAGGRTVSPAGLKAVLQKAADKHPRDLELRIRSDRGATYDAVQPVMKTAAELGIWNVTFSVVEKKKIGM